MINNRKSHRLCPCNKSSTPQDPSVFILYWLNADHCQKIRIIAIWVDLPLPFLIHVQRNFNNFSIWLGFIFLLSLNSIQVKCYVEFLLASVDPEQVFLFFSRNTSAFEFQVLDSVTWNIVSGNPSPSHVNFFELYFQSLRCLLLNLNKKLMRVWKCSQVKYFRVCLYFFEQLIISLMPVRVKWILMALVMNQGLVETINLSVNKIEFVVYWRQRFKFWSNYLLAIFVC